jgi:hypothetical protein
MTHSANLRGDPPGVACGFGAIGALLAPGAAIAPEGPATKIDGLCPPSETTHTPPPSLPPRPVRRRSASRGLSVPGPESLVSARLVRRRPGHVSGMG